MKRMAIIFNSDYQTWPMGGMISYIRQAISMLSDSFEIDLWGCSINGRTPESVTIDQICYPVSVCANAKNRRKIIPNIVRCFWGTMRHGECFDPDRYDILYFHLSASVLGWFLNHKIRSFLGDKRERPLVILHQHGMAYHHKIGDALNYFAMEQADLVFFTTDQHNLERHKLRVKNPNLIWMPSMIDTEFFSPVSDEEKQVLRTQYGIPTGKNVFIYTGRITSWKNPILLVDAFTAYQQLTGNRGYLIYVGDGELTESLRHKISQNGMDDYILLAGRQNRDSIREYLRLSDVFVLPSRGEGVSVSALEALSVGLCVTAFDVEGMHGLITDSCGILIPELTAEAFADGMVRATAGSFRPRDTAMNYSVKRVKTRMVQNIQNALEAMRCREC